MDGQTDSRKTGRQCRLAVLTGLEIDQHAESHMPQPPYITILTSCGYLNCYKFQAHSSLKRRNYHSSYLQELMMISFIKILHYNERATFEFL